MLSINVNIGLYKDKIGTINYYKLFMYHVYTDKLKDTYSNRPLSNHICNIYMEVQEQQHMLIVGPDR